MWNMFANRQAKEDNPRINKEDDDIVTDLIDGIWSQFDKDNSGCLDKNETRAFMKSVLFHMGEREFSEGDFNKFFLDFDSDKNGFITKSEMRAFIHKATGVP